MSESASPARASTALAAEPDPSRWWALAVLAAAQLMIVLDASIVNIALPSAQADLGISNADRQWIVTAYTLAFGGLLLLGGRIADYTGRKRTFIIGLLGFAGASAIGGLAPNQELLFAARALQGAFAALMAPAVAVHRDGDVHRAEGARQGVRRVRRARRWRCRDRPDRRRRADRVRLLALVPRRQRARRADRRRGRDPARAREQGARRHPVRRPRRPAGHDRAVLAGLRLHRGRPGQEPERPDVTAVQGWADPTHDHLPGRSRWCCWSRSCSGSAARATRCCRCASCSTATAAASFLVFLLVGAGLFAMFLFLTYYFQVNLGYSPLKAGFAFLPFSVGIILTAGRWPSCCPGSVPSR